MYDKLKNFLQMEPAARERLNKNRCIGTLIVNSYHLDMKKRVMAEIVGEVLSLDRAWRKILEENPELRGSDYLEKGRLEKVTQLELGYNIHESKEEEE